MWFGLERERLHDKFLKQELTGELTIDIGDCLHSNVSENLTSSFTLARGLMFQSSIFRVKKVLEVIVHFG